MINYALAILTLLTITLLSCNKVTNKSEINLPFKKPFVATIVKKDTLKCFEADLLSESSPIFAGKYTFTDTFVFSKEKINNTKYSDFVKERPLRYSDSLQTDGFEIVTDYSSNVLYYEPWVPGNNYYPVYVVNQTPTTKKFTGKDSYVFGIQEALDTAGQWRPIEGKFFDFCGNGYWGIKVHSREFVVILFPKYKGDYKTKIRIRLKIGDNIYVSKEFDGGINERQLHLQKDSYLYDQLLHNKASAIKYLFYGAEPFGTDDKDFGLHAVLTN